MRRTFIQKFIALAALLALVGAGCGGPNDAQLLASKPVSLEIWGVFDDSVAFTQLFTAYRKLHPNVSIDYREFRLDEYEDELLHAFAEGTGPDIFAIHNTWIGEYMSLIQPMPASVKIPYSETRGTIKKDTIYTLKEEPTISLRALRTDYVDAVAQDVVRSYRPTTNVQAQDRIFGIPLSVDTLALYFNRDLLNAAGLPEPAADWTTFQEQVTKLTRVNQNSTILQSGAALGTAKNVERASDILQVLLLQNGVPIVDDRGVATFGGELGGQERAVDAVNFYTDFANPLKQVYSWNADQSDSFDAFVNGKTAYFFGYSYHAPLIKAQAPKLNMGIAPLPQINGGKVVNFANYWVEAVSKQTDASDWAWDFIRFASSKEQVADYLTTAKKPTALRSLIASQLEDETLSVFSSQTLTAKSWYRGTDAQAMEKAFLDLISAVLSGSKMDQELINAQNKVNQTL